jgi:hypothetical protein
MSKERELLQRAVDLLDDYWKGGKTSDRNRKLFYDIKELLTQPEQEPVAWITEWVQRYRYDSTPIINRTVSFIKEDVPAVSNPNYIPLYTKPPKREPLSDEEIIARYKAIDVENALYVPTYYAGFRDAEKAHGIGVKV